jgi:hypothetical protein
VTVPTVGRVRAWTLPVIRLPGDVIAHKWSSDWAEEPRLIPESDTSTPGARGNASFRLLRAQRIEPDGPDTSTTDLVAGQYVAITAGVDTFDWAAVEWWGFIASINTTPLGFTGDQMGIVSALEVGHLLGTVEASGWTRTNGMGGTDAFDFQGAPDCNLRGPAGEIIGNRVELSGNSLFARASASCGTDAANYWTRWRLANHVVTYCVPAFLPTLTLSAPTDVSDLLDDTTIKEVFTVKGLSLLAIFDLVFPRSRGLSWKIVGAAGGWTVTGYSTLAEGEAGIPTQTPVDIDLAATSTRSTRSVSYTDDDTTTYDEIEVRGGQILFGGTVGYQLSNADKGWTASQETLYKAGAGDSAGYGALTLTKQREADESARKTSAVKDVYTRFVIGDQSSGGMYQYDSPTSPTGSNAFFPAAEWDGDALTFDSATYYDPQWPSTALARNIPWPKGKKADATDLRATDDKNKPQYLKPLAFYQDTPRWVDLSGKEDRRGKPSIGIDDRGCAITVDFSPSEWFAKADWSGSDGSPIIPDPSVNFSALDWRYAFYTVAIPSGQILAVRKRRSGMEAANVRRRLVVEYPELECWVMHAGSILGIDEDGAPEVLSTRTVVRNDFPIAERIAKQVAAYALTSRSAASIELDRPDAPPTWATLGTIIGTITDGAHTKTVNSCVEMISHTWGAKPRLTVRTDLPESPSFSSGLTKGGAGGGTSATLGGTVGQSILRLREDVNGQGARTQNAPLSFGFAGESLSGKTATIIHSEAHGLTNGTVVGYNSLADVWEAVDGTIYVDGVISTGITRNATIGIVVDATDDDFTLTTGGHVKGLTGLTAGVIYYVDASGQLTTTRTRAKFLHAVSATEGYIYRETHFARASVIQVDDTIVGGAVGQVVSYGGASWAKAVNSDDNDITGIIVITGAGNYDYGVAVSGVIPLAGATLGQSFYVGSTPGTLTTTRPTVDFGERVRAVAVCIEDGLVQVLAPGLVDTHEHVVPDSTIPLTKLEDFTAAGVVGVAAAAGGPLEEVNPPSGSSYAALYLRAPYLSMSLGDLEWGPILAADLDDSGVTPDTYGSGFGVPSITVSAQGIITSASEFVPSVAGDVTGDLSATVVEAIQGVDVDATTPTDQQILVYDGTGGTYVPASLLNSVGQLFYFGEDSVTHTDRMTRLPPGDEGQVLTAHGDPGELTWEDIASFIGTPTATFTTTTLAASASGTHTFTKAYFCAILIGGGGGGSGGSSGSAGASTTYGGAGGGQGERAYMWGRAPASLAYSVGAAGTAGTTPSGSGGAGGNTTLGSITANGGAAATGTSSAGAGGSNSEESFSAINDILVLRIPGAHGSKACINYITYASGLVSTYSPLSGLGGGRGAGGSGSYGDGGAGGQVNGNASAAGAGRLVIYEWD